MLREQRDGGSRVGKLSESFRQQLTWKSQDSGLAWASSSSPFPSLFSSLSPLTLRSIRTPLPTQVAQHTHVSHCNSPRFASLDSLAAPLDCSSFFAPHFSPSLSSWYPSPVPRPLEASAVSHQSHLGKLIRSGENRRESSLGGRLTLIASSLVTATMTTLLQTGSRYVSFMSFLTSQDNRISSLCRTETDISQLSSTVPSLPQTTSASLTPLPSFVRTISSRTPTPSLSVQLRVLDRSTFVFPPPLLTRSRVTSLSPDQMGRPSLE